MEDGGQRDEEIEGKDTREEVGGTRRIRSNRRNKREGKIIKQKRR
jgi:hypothetical protein